MEADIKQEELYDSYQSRIRSLEQEMEHYQKKLKHFEQKKENRKIQIREDQNQVERLTSMWNNRAETNLMQSFLEEYIDEEKKELEQEECALREERSRIQKEQSRCEEDYQNKLKDLREE